MAGGALLACWGAPYQRWDPSTFAGSGDAARAVADRAGGIGACDRSLGASGRPGEATAGRLARRWIAEVRARGGQTLCLTMTSRVPGGLTVLVTALDGRNACM